MKILGIESSCDESAVSVVTEDKQILFNSVLSQDHSKFNGVYPEFAAREHVKVLPRLIKAALDKVKPRDLDAIAVTAGPGLVGCLITGIMIARGLAFALKKPIIPVNHLEAHALSVRITEDVDFPFLLLLVSGGHSKIILVNDIGSYKELGTTVDDAFGEAFDKVATMLGLSYPGGPIVEKMAKSGNSKRFCFPRAMQSYDNCNFSLSGIKTSVRRQIQKTEKLSKDDIADICASFQECVCDIIINKISRAQKISGCRNIVAAGGVASNFYIRNKINLFCKKKQLQSFFPPMRLCTDNAAMIAWAAIENIKSGNCRMQSENIEPKSKWPI